MSDVNRTQSALSRSGWAIRWNGNLIGAAFGDRGFPDTLSLVPLVFRSRRVAREFIEDRFAYIRERPDLRQPPYNWRMPEAVKVKMTVKESK